MGEGQTTVCDDLCLYRPDNKLEENMFTRMVELEKLKEKSRRIEMADFLGDEHRDPGRWRIL